MNNEARAGYTEEGHATPRLYLTISAPDFTGKLDELVKSAREAAEKNGVYEVNIHVEVK